MPPEPILHLKAVSAAYKGLKALQGVSLEVAPGEIVAVVGANGAGKSTLLRAIAGQVATGGTIVFDGQSLAHMPSHRFKPLETVFTLFPRLQERLGQRAETLSGGEQQMLAIGRALMTGPRLLMLDEPSQGIAPKLVDDILAAIGRIRDLGVTILLVEQRLAEALDLADRAYVLQTGRIVMSGPAKQIASDDGVRRAYLGL